MLHRCLPFNRNIKLVPLLFQVTCLMGLSWQLFEISGEYFKYKVNIQTTVYIPEEVENLSMGICLSVAFAINYNKLNSKLQYNCTPHEFYRKEMIQNFSTHEIYDYTYDADNIIYNAGYWKGALGWESKSTNLSSIMNMQKYFYDSNICYLYSVKSFNPFSVYQIKRGLCCISLF